MYIAKIEGRSVFQEDHAYLFVLCTLLYASEQAEVEDFYIVFLLQALLLALLLQTGLLI